MSKKNQVSANGEAGAYVPALAEETGEYYNVNTSAEKVRRRDWLIRLIAIILLILLLLLGISFCATTILNRAGRFTVSLTPNDYGIQISATKDFSEPTLNLYAGAVENMDNITKDWLLNTDLRFPNDPVYKKFEDIDQVWGEHSGTNYLAYTFGVRNASPQEKDDETPPAVNYKVTLKLVSAMDDADEAIRVAVFRNGKCTIYAKAPIQYIGGKKQANAATGAYIRANGVEKAFADKSFVSDSVVMEETVEKFEAGKVDRYTVVVWLEGEDPECVNDIMGGEAKLAMDVEVLGKAEETQS